MDIKSKLSYIWIFLMFNYIYCDILTFFEPGILPQMLTGSISGVKFTSGVILSAAILMEIPIAMVLVSKLAKHPINRWANIIAGSFMAIMQVASLFFGSGPALHYIFFSVIEVFAAGYIAYVAWNWNTSGSGETCSLH